MMIHVRQLVFLMIVPMAVALVCWVVLTAIYAVNGACVWVGLSWADLSPSSTLLRCLDSCISIFQFE